MIQRIEKINNFGLFKNYTWQCSDDFKTFNLIYGWNYSGKTTLSRIFQIIQDKKYPEYNSDFSLKLICDGQEINKDKLLSSAFSVRVYNEDFVKSNFDWDNNVEINPFFSVGKESLELQKQHDDLFKSKKEKESIRDTKKADYHQIKTDFEKNYTKEARTIKESLGIPDYDKTKLKQDTSKIGGNYKDYVLTEDIVLKYRKSTENAMYSGKIELLPGNIDDGINDLYTKCTGILLRKVNTEKIEALVNDQRLSKWIQEGVELHNNDENRCKFCGHILEEGIIQKYLRHFSDEYENCQSEITEIKMKIDGKINYIETNFSDKYYDKLFSLNDASELTTTLKREINAYKEWLEALSKELEGKEKELFSSIQIKTPSYNITYLYTCIQNLNEIIEENNSYIDNFDERKKEIKNKLFWHHVAVAFENLQIPDTEEQLILLKSEISMLDDEINNLNTKIDIIEKEISTGTVSTEKINKYLKTYFEKDDVYLKYDSDKNKFVLIRDNKPAHYLSTGEKTAISMAYFISKLFDKDTDLKNTIIYIDDPISSLDTRHIHNTYALIKTTFSEGKNCKCGQLFISTHNQMFFNLVNDWFTRIDKNAKKEKMNCKYYYLERICNNGEYESCLMDLPKSLKNAKSEYGYLFKLIYDFHQNPTKDFQQLYLLPNICRRFLEAYVSFKYQNRDIRSNLSKIIKDDGDCEKVWKYINNYSHAVDPSITIELRDPNECYSVIRIIIDSIKNTDSEHYDGLINMLES